MKKSRLILFVLASGLSALTLGGCAQENTALESPPAGTNLVKDEAKPPADAGVAVANPQNGVPTVQMIAQTRGYGARPDPFKLLPSEIVFDREQFTERILAEGGGYSSMFTPTQDLEFAPQPLQPRPLWRVSGIVIGENGILALLDLGNGRTITIRPGMKVEGQPFEVASIDSKQAVLRRTDGREPKYVVIPLSGPLTSTGQAGGGGAGGLGVPGAPPPQQGAPPPGRGGQD